KHARPDNSTMSPRIRTSKRLEPVVPPHLRITITLRKSAILTGKKYQNELYMHVVPEHMVILNLMVLRETIRYPNTHGQKFFRKKASKPLYLSVFPRLYMECIHPRHFGIRVGLQ